MAFPRRARSTPCPRGTKARFFADFAPTWALSVGQKHASIFVRVLHFPPGTSGHGPWGDRPPSDGASHAIGHGLHDHDGPGEQTRVFEI